MHTTLVSAIGLASLFTSTFARALIERQAQCINDSVYKGLWANLPIRDDVNNFCNSLLGIPPRTNCVFYETSTSTVINGTPTATITTVDTTTVPSSTVTVITTFVEFELRKRQNQIAARAAIPTADYLKEARNAIHAELEKRQASGLGSLDYAATLTSGCRCGPPTPLATNAVCQAPANTTTLDGFDITTSYVTVTSGVTTVTETLNVTTKINTTAVASSTSSHSNWDDWITTTEPERSSTSARSSSVSSSRSSSEGPEPSSTMPASTSPEPEPSSTTSVSESSTSSSYSRSSSEPERSSTTTVRETSTTSYMIEPTLTSTSPGNYSRSSTEQSETSSTTSDESSTISYSRSTSEEPSFSSTVDTPSGTSVTTTTTASSTPTACPQKNGTVFSSNVKDCTEYEYICGRSYPPSSFYDLAVRNPSPEDCTELCDAANAGAETRCLGVIWNAASTGVNCRTLKNLDNPIDGIDTSVALILRPDADCNVSTTTRPPMTEPSGTQSRSWWPTGTDTRTWDHSWNGTWSYNHSYTRTWPTSYSSKPTYTTPANVSSTVPANVTSTTTSMNISTTIDTNFTSTTPMPYSNTTTSYPTYTTTSGNFTSTIAPNGTTTSSWTYTPSSGTGFPSSTMNSTSTCPASTITEKETVSVYNTMVETETATQTVSVTVTSFATVQVTQTAGRWDRGAWRNW